MLAMNPNSMALVVHEEIDQVPKVAEPQAQLFVKTQAALAPR